ncbi:FG-GAP-like repeat-containing protein [Hymenobacter negativus]|uniref:VCBS repeat-containing protein n=1 Tax=Hymenobacter negativus TaxID=2795026 RepID=A0ABS3QJE3_9BACT|nr:FG-GAP-like repeat-containing protein [Hymenobacter negativus]MBO2010825.1 VCBS repeat-containing protein [Hymenobacter negativus]
MKHIDSSFHQSNSPTRRHRWAYGLLFFLLNTLGAQAQQAAPLFFRDDAEAQRVAARSAGAPALLHVRPLSLDAAGLRVALTSAPSENQAGAAPLRLALPLPDGSTGRFAVVETAVMAPALAAQFPQIRTYRGVGLDDPTATVQLDLTPQGFHAQILSAASGTVYIDPTTRLDPLHCVSFYRRDMNRAAAGAVPVCQFRPSAADVAASQARAAANSQGPLQRTLIATGTTLRTFRLAVAATGEYTQFQGGTVALAQAAIVTTVNRVVGVYEKELAVRLQLIAGNSSLIYTNPSTDPYTNNDPSALLGENQTNVTNVIGTAGFDIGHVFSTAGGGYAGLGVVCNTNNKARGETGTSSPVGDAFDIDYVAHEMGHQFGGNHTFNSPNGFCAGNVNTSTAYEPGSGSTIMAYAGICSPDDLQNNSDAYFHSGSFQEMATFIATTACGTSTATGNTAPTVGVPAARVVPIGTPFRLTASATDANGDALTYSWEEMDLGSSVALTAAQVANNNVPLFRSFLPVASPTRYFPRLPAIISNTSTSAERLPTVTRTLTFRCTARDQHNGAAGVVGGVNYSSNVTLSVTNAAGPFLVTSPNIALTWAGGSTQTVTWNVAGTSANGVNCATVNVLLSTDGGLTYPTTLLSGTANDGSAPITVPNISTSTARVMVEAAGNYFFDISNANFTITPAAICDAPTNLVAGSITSSSASVSFAASGTATGYTVTTTPASTTQIISASPVSLMGLTAGTAYTVNIVSNCAGGLTASPATVGFTTAAAPTVAITSTASNPTSTVPIPVTVTFSGSVTGFVAGDVAVTNGNISGFSGSGTTYTFNITPLAIGPVTVNVPANVAQDGAGTGNTAAAPFSINFSLTVTAAPVVNTPTDGSSLNTTTPTYSGTAPAGSTVTVYVDGASIGMVTAVGGTWSLGQFTALTLGPHSVRATAQLSGQGVSLFSNSNNFIVDTTAPTVVISSTASSPTSTSPIPVTVTFSEAVTGFISGDVAVINGTISGFTAVNGTTYTFNVTPVGSGLVTVNVAANVAQDVAGNGNTAATQFSITYNASSALTITALSPTRNEKSAPQTSNVAITFNQNLTNNAATQGALKVYSAQRGGQLNRVGGGTATVSGSTLTLNPTTDFRAGELVSSTITTAATSGGGSLATPQVAQFMAAVGGTGRGNFQPGSDPGIGNASAGVIVGDVNGDGSLDLLASNFGGGTVSVRLNNGAGSFSGSQTVAVGTSPAEVVLGDIDDDGDLDLLTPNVSSNTVSVRLNNGTGTFSSSQEVGVGSSPYHAALGDVDGDGDLDLLASNYGSSTVSVRLNNGAGSFSGSQNVAAGANAYDVALGDVDSDGDLDMVVSNYTSTTVNVRVNNGAGIFSGSQTITVGNDPINIALGDIDGDGDLDFLTANNSSSTVSVSLNNGAGIFGSSQSLVVGTNPYGVTLGDVDADGDLDFLVSSHANDNVALWLNNGTGTFTNTRTIAVGSGPYNVALGDLDADGDLDFVTPNQNTTTASVRLNQAGPTIISFTPPSGPVTTVVTITGTLLTGATAVAFNGTAASSFTVNSATSITATVAAGTTTGPITVTTSDGTGTSATNFTVTQPATAAPVVITPVNGSTFSNSQPVYTGTATAGSIVKVYVDSSPLSGTVTTDAAGNWSFTQPSALAQGSHTVFATAQSSGSAVSANSNTNTFTIDTTAPTVVISSTAGSPTSTTPIPVTVTFSEAVTGFVAGDVTVTNSTLSGFTAVSGTTYTFSVTPTASGLVTVNVAANVAQDAAGNGNTAAPQFSITYNAPAVVAVWNGSVSTDWFTAANWTGGVPTATLDATIPAGAPRYPVLTSGTATAKALTLATGGSLTQSGGTLDLKGGFVNNGTFSASGGSVALTGAAAQTVGGSSLTSFWNLSVGTAGATLSGATAIQRVLTLDGNLTTGGQPFTLLSAASGTALVVNNSGVVNGTTTVQRYIDPSLNAGLGYRHYSAPVASTTVADLATSGFTPVVNLTYNTSATPSLETPFPTVFGYDQARLASAANSLNAFDKGWFSPTTLGDPLAVGRGYTVNIGASQLVDFVGTLNNGDRTLGLSRNTGATAPDAGWQLLGNPYPAPLDYSLVAQGDRPNLDAAIYVFSSTSQYNGQYRAYVNGVGGNPIIPVAQGFFTRVSPGQTSGSLTFHNSQRLTTPDATAFQRGTATDNRSRLQLTIRGASTSATDETFVYFEAGATAGVDTQYDAVKLPNSTGLNISTTAVGTELAINGLPLAVAPVTVPLTVRVPATGTYTLTATELSNFVPGAQPFLRDMQLGTLTDLSLQPAYSFSLNATSTTPRFELVFGQQVLGAASAALAAQVAVFPNPASKTVFVELPAALGRKPVNAALVDALGRVVVQQVLPVGPATHVLPLTNVAAGVYSLHLQTEAGLVVKKLLVD